MELRIGWYQYQPAESLLDKTATCCQRELPAEAGYEDGSEVSLQKRR